MADDETIVIRVNAAQGEAALRALGQAGIEAGHDIENVSPSVDKVGFGLKDMTKSVGAGISLFGVLRENLAALVPVLEKNSQLLKEQVVALGGNKGAVDALTLGLDSLIHPSHILANANTAAREGMLLLTDALYGQSDAVANLTNWEKGLAAIHARRIADQNALTAELTKSTEEVNRRTVALQAEITEELKLGPVHDGIKGKLKEQLDAYAALGVEVPKSLLAMANSLGVYSAAQDKVRDAALKAFTEQEKAIDKLRIALDGDSKARTDNTKALVEAIARVEEHGAVTLETSAKIKAAIGEELDLYKSYGDAVPASLQAVADRYNVIAKSQQVVIDNAQKIIADIDAAAVKANQAQQDQGNAGVAANAANAEQLKQQIKAIEDSPIITLEQQNNLDNLKNQLLDNTRAASDLNDVFTVTADNYLTDEEALAKYNAELAIAQEEQAKLTQWNNQAQATEKELAKARWDNLEALNQMEDAAGDAGGTFQDLGKSIGKAADAAGSLGDESKKGAEKGKEGLDKLNEGFTQAIPLAEQLRGILQEIVTLGAQADI